MNKILRDKVLYYLNKLKEEKESEAKIAEKLIGYTKLKKNQMVLEIQDDINELKRIMKWLIENE